MTRQRENDAWSSVILDFQLILVILGFEHFLL
jgi:hypothetical protein